MDQSSSVQVLRSATHKLLNKSHWTSFSTNDKHSWLKITELCEPRCQVLVCPSGNCRNSTPLSSLQSWKSSTFMSWCSCQPPRPKCWVSKNHFVFTNASGVVLPNLLSFHSNSFFVKFLVLLGRALSQ